MINTKRFLKYLLVSILGLFIIVGFCFSVTGCSMSPAEKNIQHNLLQDTGNFKTYRNIKVINLRSDIVLMEFEGYLTTKLDTEGDVNIIIRTGEDTYQLHYVRLAAEVTYISEQLDYTYSDPYHWKISIYATIPTVDNL